MQNDSGIEGDEIFTGSEKRVDVNFLNPTLLGNQLAKADHELLQSGQIHGLSSPDALEGLVNPGGLDHAPGQSGIERRQTEGLVLENLDELAAHPEEQDRAELRIDAAAKNELVTFAK